MSGTHFAACKARLAESCRRSIMDMNTSPLSTLKDHTLLRTDALINGEWVAASTRFLVADPATGWKLAEVSNHDARATEAALVAANDAWPAWRTKTAKERGA